MTESRVGMSGCCLFSRLISLLLHWADSGAVFHELAALTGPASIGAGDVRGKVSISVRCRRGPELRFRSKPGKCDPADSFARQVNLFHALEKIF